VVKRLYHFMAIIFIFYILKLSTPFKYCTKEYNGGRLGYKRISRQFELRSDVSESSLLRALSDRDLVVSAMPCVVARYKDKIRLRFSRLLVFRVEDTYSVNVSRLNSVVHVKLIGDKSTVDLSFIVHPSKVEYIGEYNGPKPWVVSSCLEDMGKSIYQEALSEAEKAARPSVSGDFSEHLAKISWISKLLMKSVLVKSEIVAINKGGLVSYIENLASTNVFSKYKTVYISGTSDRGSFRLLFIDGELAGVYALIDKQEYIGDDKALNDFEGFTRIRVYGSNTELPKSG